jgi:hypothetical protein
MFMIESLKKYHRINKYIFLNLLSKYSSPIPKDCCFRNVVFWDGGSILLEPSYFFQVMENPTEISRHKSSYFFKFHDFNYFTAILVRYI